MLATAGFVLGHLAALLVIISSCAAAGWICLRRMPFQGVAETAAFTIGTGFGVLGILLFVLGLAGRLSTLFVVLLLAGVHVLAVAISLGDISGRKRWPDMQTKGTLLLALVAFVPSFALALFPPTAFDATLYHLPYAKLFAAERAVVFAERLRFPVFPQLNEMLFSAALILYDDVTAHLVQLVAFGVTACALVSWAWRRQGRTAAHFAFAIWVGSPLAVYLSGTGYIDLGVAMFVCLAVYAMERWIETALPSWLLLSGVLAGMAAASKYHGALIAATMCVAVAILARGRRLQALGGFALAVVLTCSPFYLRNEVLTGNPFFPYLSDVFGGLHWQNRGEDRVIPPAGSAMETVAILADRTVLSREFITFPWRAASDREALKGLPPTSFFMPLVFPAALLAAVRFRILRGAFLIALAYTAASASLDPRFLIIVFPLYAVEAASWAGVLITTRWVQTLVALVLLFPGPGYGIYRLAEQGPLPVREEERRGYLARQVPPFEPLDHMNHRCGNDYSIYGLHLENAAYYADGSYWGDHLGPQRYAVVEDVIDDPAALAGRLRALRVDYILVNREYAVALDRYPGFRTVWRSEQFGVFLVPGGRDCFAESSGEKP